MGEEVFHEMLLPDSLYDPSVYCLSMRLLVWNESIALFGLQNAASQSTESFGIWVIDEFDDTKDTRGRIFSYNLGTKKLMYLPIQCVQDDSVAVVYDNYTIVSILGANRQDNNDDATNAGSSLLESSFPSSMVVNEWHSYSVWAIPPDDVSLRMKKVMEGLRSEFGGPEIEPHITIVGSVRMKNVDVLDKFRSLQSCVTSGYKAKVNQVENTSFYYQCVSLVIDSSFSSDDESYELCGTTRGCGMHFGFENSKFSSLGSRFRLKRSRKKGVSVSVRPHLSLLYGNLTGEERKKAQEKVTILDESITSMSFPITRLALYKTDYRDKRLKSWEKIAEYTLQYFN
ncbi:hypothetical protein ACLB2K_018002 [Fragaria x ananassa]